MIKTAIQLKAKIRNVSGGDSKVAMTMIRVFFMEYIDEKAQSISQLFGTRVVRNETQNYDTYNYVRAYKMSMFI